MHTLSINYIYFFIYTLCVRKKGGKQQTCAAISHLTDRKDKRLERQKRKGDLRALTDVGGVR